VTVVEAQVLCAVGVDLLLTGLLVVSGWLLLRGEEKGHVP